MVVLDEGAGGEVLEVFSLAASLVGRSIDGAALTASEICP